MYRTIRDFEYDWKYESASTLKMFRLLTDESLLKKPDGEVRNIATLAWHMTVTPSEMLSKCGFAVEGPSEHSKPPHTVAEIAEAYAGVAASVGQVIPAAWTDGMLNEKVNMYGELWKKGKVLSVLILHQAHHRGQLTVLMRLCGLKVPGIYGPAREEWAAMGLPAME